MILLIWRDDSLVEESYSVIKKLGYTSSNN